MAYIGWAVNVNKDILDSTDVTVGEGATVQDSLESGQKKTRLTCANPPDKFQVTMKFSFAEQSKDQNGMTELDRFWTWLKWSHCYGVNPFLFPAILINSNRQKGFSNEEISFGNSPNKEYYKITSAVNGTKSGTDQQVTMTWETYATGVINIPLDSSLIDHISATNGYVDVILTASPIAEPTTQTYTVYINGQAETITNVYYDGDVTTRCYFTPKTTAGLYAVVIDGLSDFFTVGS